MCQKTRVSQPVSAEEGNTKPPPDRARAWVFTLNNFTDDEYNHVLTCLRKKQKWIVGREIGDCGTPHLQGYFYNENQIRFSTLKNWNKRIHWEAAKADHNDNFKYCSKDGDYKSNYLPDIEYNGEDLPNETDLFEWQRDIIKIVTGPWQPRITYWFWSKAGGVGKSTFAKYLDYNYPRICVTGVYKTADLLTEADLQYNTYVLDFFKCVEKDRNFDPYGAIESLKNGHTSNCKLLKKTKKTMTVPNHVIVFANFPPDESKMTEEKRFDIRCLDKESVKAPPSP